MKMTRKEKQASGTKRFSGRKRVKLLAGTVGVLSLTLLPMHPAAAANFDLAVDTVESADPVKVGADLSYTLTVTNKRAVAAGVTVLSDEIPAGAKLVSYELNYPYPTQPGDTPAMCAAARATVDCTVPRTVMGEDWSVTIVVRPTYGASAKVTVNGETAVNEITLVANTVTVQAQGSDGHDGNVSNNTDVEFTGVTPY